MEQAAVAHEARMRDLNRQIAEASGDVPAAHVPRLVKIGRKQEQNDSTRNKEAAIAKRLNALDIDRHAVTFVVMVLQAKSNLSHQIPQLVEAVSKKWKDHDAKLGVSARDPKRNYEAAKVRARLYRWNRAYGSIEKAIQGIAESARKNLP
jgi:hypothetical protein